MLDSETKRRIDMARDILVGKIPDPKSQVEQITIALVYKFMDDMDEDSRELGGKATFFKGEFQKYAWHKIFDPKMSGIELVNAYGEAIQKMNQNPNIPQLFRDIFKNAYLPYRDPETLKSFLKIIGEFEYTHSERLGDAFEYLLSVLGSQGEAGQFRTPRHIIDFMVEIIDPKKNESILDPACGTAGFLISSYKHILKHNSKNFNPEKDRKAFELHDVNLEEITINNKEYKGDELSSDDKEWLVNNIKGYDISPDMVRLSLVNMYLHEFKKPKIAEYDTLTSEDKWGEYADVILANPPFMSPTGGIRPHKRFSIQSNRSEVLFVDYIAEHLTPQGRSCVIVPEGIIFKSQSSEKNLRKMLIEKGFLAGIISLPAGIFNPYSSVKTSILWLDKNLAKKTDKIIFIKIENDGFDLGAQRRPIKNNDLPEAFRAICAYKESLFGNGKFVAKKWPKIILVEKDKIIESGDYNFSGDRYRVTINNVNIKWPMVELGKLLDYEQPTKYIVKSIYYDDKFPTPVLTAGKSFILGYTNEKEGIFHNRLPVIIFDDFTTAIKYVDFSFKVKSSAMKILHAKKEVANIRYVFYMMKKIDFIPGEHKRYWISQYSKIKIPLPPLSIQQEIVTEIDGYQKIVEGAQQVVENYKPNIDIDPSWPVVELEEVIKLIRGVVYSKGNEVSDGGHPILRANNISLNGTLVLDDIKHISGKLALREDQKLKAKDIFICLASGSKDHIGKVAYIENDIKYFFGGFMGVVRIKSEEVNPKYIYYLLRSTTFNDYLRRAISGANINNLNAGILGRYKIALPNYSIQQSIVENLIAEESLVSSSTKLIDKFESKIKLRIDQVWGEKLFALI